MVAVYFFPATGQLHEYHNCEHVNIPVLHDVTGDGSLVAQISAKLPVSDDQFLVEVGEPCTHFVCLPKRHHIQHAFNVEYCTNIGG